MLSIIKKNVSKINYFVRTLNVWKQIGLPNLCLIKIPIIIVFFLSIYSPEIVQNQPYGEKADVWALGCILYQMCVLKPPFYSDNMLSLVTKVC